jgi:uroporphyrinogen-III synthase
MIEDAGGRALRLPAMVIGDASDADALARLARRIDQYDLAIFVSPNAVQGALAALGGSLPARLKLAAVGPATARALASATGRDVIVPPSGFDSESLLRLPELEDTAGKRVVIFRGDSGRGLLREVLAARGATVEYAEVYSRDMPPAPAAAVATALRRGQVDAAIVTSAQALEQLVALCGDDLLAGLLRAQLVVPSKRMVQLAQSLGFGTPVVANEPVDRALIEALAAWRVGPPQETD